MDTRFEIKIVSDTSVKSVENLITALEKGHVAHSQPLEVAQHLPGWWVQRDHHSIYQVWTPFHRQDPVWALGPPHLQMNREEFISYLSRTWLDDAKEWVILQYQFRGTK